MDLGKKESQIPIITEGGELVEKRMRTERKRVRQYFKERPPSKVLIEASTISEWVARVLEETFYRLLSAGSHRRRLCRVCSAPASGRRPPRSPHHPSLATRELATAGPLTAQRV
jgi:hypothetical protein